MSRLSVIILALLVPLAAAAQGTDPAAGGTELPVAPDGSVVGDPAPATAPDIPVFEEPPQPATDVPVAKDVPVDVVQRLKVLFLDVKADIATLQTRSATMDGAVQQMQSNLKLLDDMGLPDLAGRIAALEAGAAADPGDSEALRKRLDDIEARLALLEAAGPAVPGVGGPVAAAVPAAQIAALVAAEVEKQTAAMMAAVAAGQAAATTPPPVDVPGTGGVLPTPPAERWPFVAVVDGNGVLRSLHKSELGAEDKAGMIAEADCAAAGAWFETAFVKPDYRAFFVVADDGIRVCTRGALGWRTVRAENSKRAHLLKRGA